MFSGEVATAGTCSPWNVILIVEYYHIMKHACEDTNTQNVFSGNVATAGTGRVILYYSRILSHTHTHTGDEIGRANRPITITYNDVIL